MKRLVTLLLIGSMVFGLSAFQCSSTEITSAKLYIQQKNYPKALESLKDETEKNPQSDEGFYLMGYVYGELEEYENMVNAFNRSLKISNKFASEIEDTRNFHWQQNFNKGVGLYNRGTKVASEDSTKMYFQRAIEAFENAITVQPDSSQTYKNLTYAYYNVGQIDEAIRPLEKTIALTNEPDAYAMLGEIYYNKGIALMNEYNTSGNAEDSVKAMEFYNKTIEVLEKGRKSHPENSDILLVLSNAYVNANKLDVAMDAFKEGVQKDPDNKYYRYNYGVLLLGAEEFESAVDQFNKAIEIDPEYSNALYNLGVSYVKWGTMMREASLDKDEEDTAYLEKFRSSLEPLKKYVEQNPEDGKVWDLLGKVYANLGMTEESKEAFDKADMYR